MPISFTKPKSPDEVVQFNSVQLQERVTFLGVVNAQIERSRQKVLLVFVHCFNVDFESAVIRADQVALGNRNTDPNSVYDPKAPCDVRGFSEAGCGYNAGWTDPQIVATVHVASFFAYMNRVAEAFGLRSS